MSPKRKLGIALILFGVSIAFLAFVLIGNDVNGSRTGDQISFYTYTPPYSSHERGRLFLLVVGIVTSIIGIVQFAKGKYE